MTIRKNFRMAQRHIAQGGLISLVVTGLVGCTSVSSMLEPDRLDYKSASKVASTPLDIPPDLTQLQRENRYTIPDANRGTATASDFKSQQAAQPTATPNVAIAPKALPDIRMERDANQRWLVVNKTPEVLWQQIKDFWQDSGFIINIETQDSGIMETDWAENRLKIPRDIVHRVLGSLGESISDTGERDKFRTRLERRADGSTEIYISHRGAVEELVGDRKDSTRWTTRPSDPALEVDALSRLMIRLGVEGEKVKAAVARATIQPTRTKLVKAAAGSYLEADEGFDRTWRRVGLALDRVGFTVEDRDRAQGVYFVRYVNQDQDANVKSNSDGFFSKLFSSSDDKSKLAQRYRVAIKGSGDTSQVSVLNNEGRPEISTTADKILSLLNEQLK